ncbi:MAG: hypothetical protein AVDCRST_MAG89-2372, partial [uncultured Gemmatimonadetes bacterium]
APRGVGVGVDVGGLLLGRVQLAAHDGVGAGLRRQAHAQAAGKAVLQLAQQEAFQPGVRRFVLERLDVHAPDVLRQPAAGKAV